MRLDKYLSDAGYGSRTDVKKLIKKNRVIVNDQLAKDPNAKISLTDVIYVDEKKVVYYENLYLMMNKPAGVISATTDNDHQTVIDLIKEYPTKNLFPVGRLDIDTVGLLLLTTDGNFAHQLTNPKSAIYKTYYAKFDGIYNDQIPQIFLEGLTLDGEKTMPAYFHYLGNNECTVAICEGKYHQVKRMLKSVQLTITYLKRIQYGALLLDDSLEEGAYRMLTDEEKIKLFEQNIN